MNVRSDIMEEAVKASLRQLKGACIGGLGETRYQHIHEGGTMVTVSKLALQHLRREEGRSGRSTSDSSFCALLEEVVLEGLQEITAPGQHQEGDIIDKPTDTLIDAIWSHCFNLVRLSSVILDGSTSSHSATLRKAVSSLYQVSFRVSRLLDVFLSVGKAELTERQVLTILSRLHKKFWSQKAKMFAEQVTLTTAAAAQTASLEPDNCLEKLVGLVATLHSTLSIHKTIVASLADHQVEGEEVSGKRATEKSVMAHRSEITTQWLCWGVLCSVVDSFTTWAPKLLWSAYERAGEMDRSALQRRAQMGDVPNQLKVRNNCPKK